jgi:hypothetical protein
MDAVHAGQRLDCRREFGLTDAHEHVDVPFREGAAHGGRTHVLDLCAGHQPEQHRPMGTKPSPRPRRANRLRV